jgi:hypothetical protein
LTVEILGLGIWSLRDYKSRSKESERHTLSICSWRKDFAGPGRKSWLKKLGQKKKGLKKLAKKQGEKAGPEKAGPYRLSLLGCKKFLN